MAYNILSSTQNIYCRYVQGGSTGSTTYGIGWWNRYVFPTSSDDIQFTITPKYVNRADLISYDMYGIADYEWFVLQYNNIINPKLELINGAVLMLPTEYRLQTQLLTNRILPSGTTD